MTTPGKAPGRLALLEALASLCLPSTTTFDILCASGLSGLAELDGASELAVASVLSGASAAHCYMPSAPNPRLFWL